MLTQSGPSENVTLIEFYIGRKFQDNRKIEHWLLNVFDMFIDTRLKW